MKQNTIISKIKLIGILFVLLMISIITTIIYLNEKNKKDASIINMAGKQRMLTQKISKNIFYIYYNPTATSELEEATSEFISNLNTLKNKKLTLAILNDSDLNIKKQLLKVELLWNDFYNNIEAFKENIHKKNDLNQVFLDNILKTIYDTNNPILNELDILVGMYTSYSEEKTDYIRYIQYFFALLILLLIAYSFYQLKAIQSNAKKFFELSKQVTQNPDDVILKHFEIDAEEEIVEATDTINSFITKINSAMTYSANAVEQSKYASIKLEEITDEFDTILNELHGSAQISKHLDKSEEIVIQTQEDLLNSTKKLQELKKELDLLLNSCKIN